MSAPFISHGDWPVEPGAIIPFIAAVAMVEITPGPNMAYLATLSAMEGRRAGLKAVAGITLGLAVYLIAAVIGVTELFLTSVAAYEALRWCGVAYLFWLAFETWRGGESAPDRPGGSGAAPFVRGLTANLLNVKAAIFYAGLLPGFIAPDHGPPYRQALILGGAHLTISVLVHTSIVFGAARASGIIRRVQSGPEGAYVRGALACGVALIGVWLLWETRR